MLRLLFKIALALSLAAAALAQELTVPEERLISLFEVIKAQSILALRITQFRNDLHPAIALQLLRKEKAWN